MQKDAAANVLYATRSYESAEKERNRFEAIPT